MFINVMAGIYLSISALFGQVSEAMKEPAVLGYRTMSLSNRYGSERVNEVMKKNILLNLSYLSGEVSDKSQIDWGNVVANKSFEFTLKPGEVFAYHNIILPEYKDMVAYTVETFFNASDGYLNDGYLFGDGVCHFASLINWAAMDAGLTTYVPKDHDFAVIPEVPKEYGVSIYTDPTRNVGGKNNLYVTNSKDHNVTFRIEHKDNELIVAVIEG